MKPQLLRVVADHDAQKQWAQKVLIASAGGSAAASATALMIAANSVAEDVTAAISVLLHIVDVARR